MIYAGATILGRITIGRGSIIGKCLATHSVAAGSQIYSHRMSLIKKSYCRLKTIDVK